MLCNRCGCELLIDHVAQQTNGDVQITTYYYVCRNPQCSLYGESISATGESTERKIRM